MAVYTLGLDLGTRRTRIWCPWRGELLDTPSVQHGSPAGQADRWIETTARFGVEGSTVHGATDVEAFLAALFRRLVGRRLGRPRVVSVLASGSTPLEQRSLRQVVLEAGARAVDLVPQGTIAALGLGLDLDAPEAHLLVDLGAAATRVEVVVFGHSVFADRFPVALATLEAAVAQRLRREYDLWVGEDDLARLTAWHGDAEVSGRDLTSGVRRSILLTADALTEERAAYARSVAEGVRALLMRLPPEIGADVAVNGLYLMGGGAHVHGVGDLLTGLLGLPVRVADEPERLLARALRLPDHAARPFVQMGARKPPGSLFASVSGSPAWSSTTTGTPSSLAAAATSSPNPASTRRRPFSLP
jgi:rod shape-determining protein MreB